MSIVSNTGPLVALAKVNRLDLLSRLFGDVYIPPAVHRELLGKAGPEVAHLDSAFNTFVHIADHPKFSAEIQGATLHIDQGEREAIALAYQLRLLLVIDDRQGRQAARRLALLYTGVAGVIIQAKEASLIKLVVPVLEEIRFQGYWLTDELIYQTALRAGEAPSRE